MFWDFQALAFTGFCFLFLGIQAVKKVERSSGWPLNHEQWHEERGPPAISVPQWKHQTPGKPSRPSQPQHNSQLEATTRLTPAAALGRQNCPAVPFPNCRIVSKEVVVVLLRHRAYGGFLCSNRSLLIAPYQMSRFFQLLWFYSLGCEEVLTDKEAKFQGESIP